MELKLVAGPEKIQESVKRLAAEISRDYAGKKPVLVAVLKGSFMFIADLARLIEVPLQLGFISAESYGQGTCSSGKVRIKNDLRMDVSGRDVLIVDDILDSGLTLSFIREHILARGPASVKVCVLLDKPARRIVHCQADYTGMGMPDTFLVGYGLDYAEDYRGLPAIYELSEKKVKEGLTP